MEILLDTVNIDDIKRFVDYFPIAGVTSNPSIVKKETPKEFFDHMNKIRDIIGPERSLHVQITETTYDGMVKEAQSIAKNIDDHVYMKIPADFEGIKAIKELKSKGFNVTATAIYDYMQALVAVVSGADYIAPYVNRIANIGGDPFSLIDDLNYQIKEGHYDCKIVAASFHTLNQVADACRVGTQAITIQPSLLREVFENPNIALAVEGFRDDWYSMYNNNLTKC